MRQTVIVGMEEWEVVPFLPYVREEKCTIVTVSIPQGAELWWVVAGIQLTLTLQVDPLTSAAASGTYTRVILMERELLDPGLEEENLGFPGFWDDAAQAVAPFEPGCFDFGGTVALGADDVFNSTELSSSLNLWGGGYGSGGAGLVSLSFKLRASLLYDDGTEGTILIQSDPEDDDPDPFEFIYSLTTTATFLGNNVTVRCGDTAAGVGGPSSYFYLGVAPTIVLEPKLWFEHRRFNGNEPIYDASTGVALIDPRTPIE